MNSASCEYRNVSARRGAQFVPIGVPIICWKSRRILMTELNHKLVIEAKGPSPDRVQPFPSSHTATSEVSSQSEAASDEMV